MGAGAMLGAAARALCCVALRRFGVVGRGVSAGGSGFLVCDREKGSVNVDTRGWVGVSPGSRGMCVAWSQGGWTSSQKRRLARQRGAQRVTSARTVMKSAT
ncbi:hypothetical protein EDB84DRAFT_1121640 [Lactarius hengduanensis]|nr:hypothetical protein EDB84DRAFT_1121640 [Lactarius hengduanensis]